MVEAVPLKPYGLLSSENTLNECRNALFSLVERWSKMNQLLKAESLRLLSIPNFPSLGEGNFLAARDKTLIDHQNSRNLAEENHASQSEYILENLANPHPRFPTLMKNIWERWGKKVNIQVPVYQDVNTQEDMIHMDSMHFGMGMCCLQVTFET